MAKKQEKSKFSFSKIGDILDGIAEKVPIIIDNEIKEKVFISTGVYVLDAALSSRLLGGGVENGRIFTLAGDSGTGKSYVALSIAKNAQKMGFGVMYIDTEHAIEVEQLPGYGVDTSPDKWILVRTNKVEDINITLTQMLDSLKDEKLSGAEVAPMLIILDSVGQMSSNKEKNDLIAGDLKVDMTRAKALAALFRSINSDLGFLGIPMVVCNHVYLEQGNMFPQEILKGGKALVYSSSVIGMLSKAKLKTGEEGEMDLGQSGIVVSFKTVKNRLAKPKKIKFEISFVSGMNPYSGLEVFCTPENFSRIGIAQGKMDINKKTGEMNFVPGGTRWYVSHLEKSFTLKQLFRPEIFTEAVLKKMEPIVNEFFKYKSIDEISAVDKELSEIIEDDQFGETDLDEMDSSDLFK
jgi:RecA/RadA recombinase